MCVCNTRKKRCKGPSIQVKHYLSLSPYRNRWYLSPRYHHHKRVRKMPIVFTRIRCIPQRAPSGAGDAIRAEESIRKGTILFSFLLLSIKRSKQREARISTLTVKKREQQQQQQQSSFFLFQTGADELRPKRGRRRSLGQHGAFLHRLIGFSEGARAGRRARPNLMGDSSTKVIYPAHEKAWDRQLYTSTHIFFPFSLLFFFFLIFSRSAEGRQDWKQPTRRRAIFTCV